MVLLLLPVAALVRLYKRQNTQALAELRQAQNRLCDMAEASSDWLWEMGADLRFTHFSGTVARVVAGDVLAFIGKTRLEIADRSLAPDAWAKHEDDLANRRPFRDFVYPCETSMAASTTAEFPAGRSSMKAARFSAIAAPART